MRTPVGMLVVLVFSLAVAAGATAQPVTTTAPAAVPRRCVVISDTHFGVGHDPATGRWSRLEDFRWARDFDAFLDHLEADRVPTDLVLNGDTFELWQSLAADCPAAAGANLGCKADEALARMKVITREHAAELTRLGDFSRSGSNAIVIVPGNHDAGLLFEAVAAEAIRALGPGARAAVRTEGWWSSADGRIWTEHGHQIGEEVNRFEDWPKPFKADPGGTLHLEAPWGEQFVRGYYTEFEIEFEAIDNIGDRGGLGFALAAVGPKRRGTASRDFVKFFFTEVTAHQFGGALEGEPGEDDDDSEWDVSIERARKGAFLAESIPTSDPLSAVVREQAAAGALDDIVAELDNDEIDAICESRATLVREAKELGKDAGLSPCQPAGSQQMGAALAKVFVARDRGMRDHLNAMAALQARTAPGTGPFRVFVYSHTHSPDSFSPFHSGDWRPNVLNTGAWQRRVTTPEVREWADRCDLPDARALPSLTLETLPACYSYVQVDPTPSDRKPNPRLLFWCNCDGAGGKPMGEPCTKLGPCPAAPR